MKKIGHETLFLKTDENTSRRGESTFLRLSEDRILLAYTEYRRDNSDHGEATICACISADEGESWGEPFVLLKKDPAAQNYMSPALVRMPNGQVGLFYLRKQIMEDGGIVCMPCFRRSGDEGKTWSEQIICPIPDGYYCGINDGAVVTRDGRLLWAVSYHGVRLDPDGTHPGKWKAENEICVVCSGDNGENWSVLEGRVKSPFASTDGRFAEPGLYEREDGVLWMWIRTALGHQYDTLSEDGGKTWLAPEPNLRFTSPDCPMRVKKCGDAVIAVFNPVPFHCLNSQKEVWNSPKRTPIVCAVSRDDALSFCKRGATFGNGGLREFVSQVWLLEDDETDSYCYPALQETSDGFLAAYYHSDGTPYCLNATKVVKVYRSEIE